MNGHELAQAFLRGEQPRQIQVRFNLNPGEFCVADLPVEVYQQVAAGDGSYMKKRGGYIIGGSPGGMVAGGMFSAAKLAVNVGGNQIRKQRARRDATVQWRQVESGRLFMTSERLAVKGSNTWLDLWYENLAMSERNGQFLELHTSGDIPLRLEITELDYWFVMFNKLAYDRVDIPPAAPTVTATTRSAPRGALTGSVVGIPIGLLGRWTNVEDEGKVLTISRDGTFVLELATSDRQTGQVSLSGTSLTLKSGTAVTTFVWAVDGDELRLRRPDASVSSYRRAPVI